MHPVSPGALQVAAEPPGWLLRNSALAEALPWEALGALRAPTGVERLLARTGKRLRASYCMHTSLPLFQPPGPRSPLGLGRPSCPRCMSARGLIAF